MLSKLELGSNVTDVKSDAYSNVYCPITGTPAGIVMEVKDVLRNAFCPMLVNRVPVSIVTEVKLDIPANVSSPMLVK